MANTTHPLPVEEISREILDRMTDGLGGMSLVEAIDDGAFVVDDQTVTYWIGEAVALARHGSPTIDDEERAPEGYACAECGTQDATNYLVTVLDHDDIRHTRTEACIPCAVTVAAADIAQIIAGLTEHGTPLALAAETDQLRALLDQAETAIEEAERSTEADTMDAVFEARDGAADALRALLAALRPAAS